MNKQVSLLDAVINHLNIDQVQFTKVTIGETNRNATHTLIDLFKD